MEKQGVESPVPNGVSCCRKGSSRQGDQEGLPVNFTVTTATERTTLDKEPKGFFCCPATDHTTSDASKFITAKQWLAQQTQAKKAEAEAEAERHEKGHVADQHPAHE